MMIKHRRTRPAATALAMLVVAACGNLTAGGFSDVTVVVSGDADTLSLAAQFSTLPAATTWPATAGPTLTENEAEGEVEADFFVFLITEGGDSLQLGDEIRVRVDLRGRSEMDVLDRQIIPATRYTELLLVFKEISAEVQGLVIDSVDVTEVHVELEQLSLSVRRPIDLDVPPGASVELVVDLNTPAWLQAVDPLTGAVNETVFEDLINVVVR